jgi:hypothetical protein
VPDLHYCGRQSTQVQILPIKDERAVDHIGCCKYPHVIATTHVVASSSSSSVTVVYTGGVPQVLDSGDEGIPTIWL